MSHHKGYHSAGAGSIKNNRCSDGFIVAMQLLNGIEIEFLIVSK
jgi:hypothetical protein